jgi:hypothetical protein
LHGGSSIAALLYGLGGFGGGGGANSFGQTGGTATGNSYK